MPSITKWNENYEKIIKVIRKKLAIYTKDLARYDVLIPRDKVMFKDRILDLRKKVEFYEDVLYKYDNPDMEIEDEFIGDVLISGRVESKSMIDSEYGSFPVFYKKTKKELIDEYFGVISSINDLNFIDTDNKASYRDLAEQYYFRYAALIRNAPYVRKGVVQNQILNPGTKEEWQKYVNMCRKNQQYANSTDYKRELLTSKLYELQEQLMNLSNKNSIEKNKIRAEIADLKCQIVALKMEHDKFELLSNSAGFRVEAIEGKISNDYFAYLISKLEANDKVNHELLNIESFNAAIEKNDSELRLLALEDEPNEELRATLLRHGETLERLKDAAYINLSRARKNRLKNEILHAYNSEAISLKERNDKLALLDSFVVVNEAVEKEVSIYSDDKSEEISMGSL